jgi:hypothetical protein
VAGTGGHVSTKVVAPPFVEVDVLKGISKLVFRNLVYSTTHTCKKAFRFPYQAH